MELTEERVREIVREEVSQIRDEWRESHTWDKFEKHLDDSGFREEREKMYREIAPTLNDAITKTLNKQIDERLDERLG